MKKNRIRCVICQKLKTEFKFKPWTRNANHLQCGVCLKCVAVMAKFKTVKGYLRAKEKESGELNRFRF